MELTVRFDGPSWITKLVQIALPLGAIGMAGLALAVPKTWKPGDVLGAADLNANFAELDAARVTVTEWKPYTVDVTANGTAVATTPDGGSGSAAYWRRVGDSADVIIDVAFPSCSATGGLTWSLPAGVAPEALKLPGAYPVVGSALVDNGGTGTQVNVTAFVYKGSARVGVESPSQNMGIDCGSVGAGGSVRMHFTIPVQGWTVNN